MSKLSEECLKKGLTVKVHYLPTLVPRMSNMDSKGKNQQPRVAGYHRYACNRSACNLQSMQLHKRMQDNTIWKSSSDIENHVQLEKQARSKSKHWCKDCDILFTSGARFGEHKWTHSQVYPYTCKLCGSLIPDHVMLFEHLMSMHQEIGACLHTVYQS